MAGPRYIADRVDAVALDGLTLFYHDASGMTHIVAPPAPEIMTALAAGPADADELLARLAEHYAFEGGEAIHARLAELETAGLVRRA